MSAVELELPSVADEDTVNILIVDDLAEKLLVFQSILEDLGQNLVMARSGQDALRQLLEQEFAVILLDVNMPDIDGFETAAMIRQYKKTAQTPIIFITAYADDLQTARGYSLGAVDYITTPVVPDILRSKVKVFVDLYRMNRQVVLWAQEREALVRAEAARAAAEEATRRADFLAEASHVLTRSLDNDSIAAGLLNLLVPALADIATLTLTDQRGQITRHLSIVHASGELRHGPAVRVEPPPQTSELIRTAVNSGAPHTSAAGGTWQVHELEHGDPTYIAVRRVSVLPLRVGTESLGSLLLAFGPLREDNAGDDALIDEVASRAAIAIENGQLYSAIQAEDRRKNEFLAMLAHELRNPLAPIRNAIHVLQMLKLEDPKQIWATTIVDRQIDHIAHIVDDLLDVSRIARGKVAIQKNTVSLQMVLQQAVETSRPHINRKRHRLTVDVPIDTVLLQGDLVRLTQVFSNLLNNAAKYTPAGGNIQLEAQRANGVVTVSVRDNGEGIARDFLPYVFDLFAQAQQALDRSQGGLGVGLTLVKQLVELHGGKIAATSPGPGLGSEFVVQLPEQVGAAIECGVDVADAPDRLPPAAEQRILIVDDLEAAADSMRILFEMKGYRVETAYDGVSALAAARDFCPAVVLLDIGLPTMDGYEVARQLRSVPQLDSALLIALTGYGQAVDRQRAMEAGFDIHLIKPADIDALCNIVADHCDNSDLRCAAN